MSSTRKRQLEELEHLDAAQQPIANASLHAAVTSLSPLKKGRNSNYFEGTVADQSTKLRLVGFSSDQQRKLSTFFKNRTTINLKNCQIKESREGNKMEVMLKSNTQILQSDKIIDHSSIDSDDVNTPAFITLSELPTTQNFQRVSVTVKVIDCKSPCYVAGEKLKQDITIADETANAKLTVWEDYVEKLELSKSYSLRSFTVREYASNKYLSMPKEGFEVEAIDDIGAVDDDIPSVSENLMMLKSAQIIGVPQLDSYKSCLTCKARVEPDSPHDQGSPQLGRCTKCEMLQRIDHCSEQMSAKLLFMISKPQGTIKPLHAFGRIIQDLAGASDPATVTREGLLTSKPVTVTYNDKHIITAFQPES